VILLDFVEKCRKMISFDTSIEGSTTDLVLWLEKEASIQGLCAEAFSENFNGKDQSNIILSLDNVSGLEQFVIQSHLDTVDPGPISLWSVNRMNPFDAVIDDGKIYGLGAADVKLDFLCKLEALKAFKGKKTKDFKIQPVLIGTFGEESGMQGMLRLIRRNKLSAKKALIGEPSNLNLIYAGKGYVRVEIEVPYSNEERQYRLDHNLLESTSTQSRIFVGKSSHSSLPQDGDSAIKKMFEFLRQLPEGLALMEVNGGSNLNSVPSEAMIEFDIISNISDPMTLKLRKIFEQLLILETEFASYIDPAFNPSTPSLNIGLIRSNEDAVRMCGCCRFPPIVSDSVFQEWISRIQSACVKIGAQFRVVEYRKPFNTNIESDFSKICMSELIKIQPKAQFQTQSNTNEASLLTRIGVECLSFGAGVREGNIHTPNENVSLLDLQKCIEFYKNIIERICL
jgi:succinyl-diaminopimelate desuccinylase